MYIPSDLSFQSLDRIAQYYIDFQNINHGKLYQLSYDSINQEWQILNCSFDDAKKFIQHIEDTGYQIISYRANENIVGNNPLDPACFTYVLANMNTRNMYLVKVGGGMLTINPVDTDLDVGALDEYLGENDYSNMQILSSYPVRQKLRQMMLSKFTQDLQNSIARMSLDLDNTFNKSMARVKLDKAKLLGHIRELRSKDQSVFIDVDKIESNLNLSIERLDLLKVQIQKLLEEIKNAQE
jgi:hypothetical protein